MKAAEVLGGLLLLCLLLAGCDSAGTAEEGGKQEVGSVISTGEPQAGEDTLESTQSGFFFDGYSNGLGGDILEDGLRIPSSFGDDSRRERTVAALQRWGVYQQTPAHTVSRGERTLLELYSEEEKRATGVVFHLWSQQGASADPRRKEQSAAWAETETYCALLRWDGFEKLGTLAYNSDSSRRTLQESFSDLGGNQQAYITYEYAPGIPFPIISRCQNTSAGHGEITEFSPNLWDILNRPHRFCLYKEKMEFDETGQWQGYDGGFHAGNRASCLYDGTGQLQTIREESAELAMDGGSPVTGEIDFGYQNDRLDTVCYWFDHRGGSTDDSSGVIAYDGQGRPQNKEYYVTHGAHYCVYLYEGAETRPWLCLEFCSQAVGPQDEDGVYAGCAFLAYLFQNEQESNGSIVPMTAE